MADEDNLAIYTSSGLGGLLILRKPVLLTIVGTTLSIINREGKVLFSDEIPSIKLIPNLVTQSALSLKSPKGRIAIQGILQPKRYADFPPTGNPWFDKLLTAQLGAAKNNWLAANKFVAEAVGGFLVKKGVKH